jgi:hypothetical protein
MNKGRSHRRSTSPFTAYGKAIRARDRLRVYLKNQIAREGKGSALGVLKARVDPMANGSRRPSSRSSCSTSSSRPTVV